MNVSVVTTGLVPLCIGSIEEMVFDGVLNELPWFIGGGSVTMYVVDPNGVLTSFPMVIDPTGYKATYNYTIIGPASVSTNGDPLSPPWRVAFLAIDAQGRTQKSRPAAFNVLSSPV